MHTPDAHARCTQERLDELQRRHDELDAALAEEEQQFGSSMEGKQAELRAKFAAQQEEIVENEKKVKEVKALLEKERTQLQAETNERVAAEEAMKEAREDAQAKADEHGEREGRLTEQLNDIKAERQRIEAEAAEEGSARRMQLDRMQSEHTECARKQKEAAERAAEFEKQYVQEAKLRKDLHNQLQELVGNLRVYCRVRPLVGANEQQGKMCVDVEASDRVTLRDHESERADNKHFEFTQVYGPGTPQEDVFHDTEPLMTSVLDGFNVCIFAYGQSGTGKTFTMEGTDEKPGLVPRAMGRVFEVVADRQSNYQHECFLSMIEIYNENIRDLLAPKDADTSKKKYDIMRDAMVGMYVKDLTSEPVHTASHCKALIRQGNTTRSTAATGLNDQSSRSHCLVTLTVRTTDLNTGDHYVGKLSLVDLAGSERLAK